MEELRLPRTAGARLALGALVVLALPALVLAQAGNGKTGGGKTLVLHAKTFKHQPASEALDLVRMRLSPQGTVELQPGANTLVIRDTPQTVYEIIQLLRQFDHPVRPIVLEIHLLEATKKKPTVSSGRSTPSELPVQLVERLSQFFAYANYRVLAQVPVRTFEGQEVSYELEEEFVVTFTVGTVQLHQRPDPEAGVTGERLKLRAFQVKRRNSPKPLIRFHLNLHPDNPVSLVLAQSEASERVLVVAVTWNQSALEVTQKLGVPE